MSGKVIQTRAERDAVVAEVAVKPLE